MSLQPISKETGYNGPGIYWIKLFKNQQPVEIHRLGGPDKSGVLAIGCTSNIERRRRQLISSSGGELGHSEGMQWFLVKQFSKLGGEEFSL